MSFYRETIVKAVRKPRQCIGCCATVNVGEPALDCSGHYNGDFWSATYHQECRAAECALNDLHDLRSGDDWMGLSDIEWDDWPWLIAEHPVVAGRMKVTTERYQDAVERSQICRSAFAKRAEA